MRKLIAGIATGALAAGALFAPASAAPKQQKVEGSILLPAPYTDDSGCFSGVHRRGHVAAGHAHSGVIGYSFPVDKTTWKKPFKLETSGGSGYVDMDISFYLAPLTTADDVIAAGGDPAAPPNVAFQTREAGGEKGIVPEAAENVIICMYGGAQGVGIGASFTYTAGKGVK